MPGAAVDKNKRKHADSGRRLHAARLTAGEYEVSELLRKWPSVKDATYRAAEKGRRQASNDLLVLATRQFGVSYDYLSKGEASTARDDEAAAIEAVLVSYEEQGFGFDGEDIVSRLRRMRMAAGFRSARVAASRFGWKTQRYSDHESRRRGITFDQAVRYSTSFGMSARAFILGTPREDRHRSDSSPALMQEYAHWGWLDVPSSHNLVRWPVIVLTSGRFRRLANDISIPVDMVNPELRHAPG
jgi:hypothetical protein